MVGTITESAHQFSVTNSVFVFFVFSQESFPARNYSQRKLCFLQGGKNVICQTRPISQSHGSNSVHLGCVETAGKSDSSPIPSQIKNQNCFQQQNNVFLMSGVRGQRSEWADSLVAIELQCRATPQNNTETTIKRCIYTHRPFYSNSAQES